MRASRYLTIGLIALCLMQVPGPANASIEPTGRSVGLIQFDATIYVRRQLDLPNSTIFARYWVCPQYYALAIPWTEPRVFSILYLSGLACLSDDSGFHRHHSWYTKPQYVDRSYQKPVGDRPPFTWGGGVYSPNDVRFADFAALSRRLFERDLKDLQASGTMEFHDPARKVSSVRYKAAGGRLESLDILDKDNRPFCKIKYEYTSDDHPPKLDKLIAELPVRPQMIARRGTIKLYNPGTGEYRVRPSEAEYVYHKGRRICQVMYQDIQLGQRLVRLPVRIEVRIASNNLLLRSATLSNFKLVNMTKEQVWQQAKTYAHWGPEDHSRMRLLGKYVDIQPRLRIPGFAVDPNDMAFVKALMAKYPVPRRPTPFISTEPPPNLDPNDLARSFQQIEQYRQRQRSQREEHRRQFEAIPKPPRMHIEPNDLRAIRNLMVYFYQVKRSQPDQQQIAQSDPNQLARHSLSDTQATQQISAILRQLEDIYRYHHRPALPEDLPPEMDPNDRLTIQQLQAYFTNLLESKDSDLPYRLKAICALCDIDRLLKDYRSLQAHIKQHLEMAIKEKIGTVYLDIGSEYLMILLQDGQMDMAADLVRTWTSTAVAQLAPDEVVNFGPYVLKQPHQLWAALNLADALLARPGLTALQRYAGLAIRAIALTRMDALVKDLETGQIVNNEAAETSARFILRMASRQQIANQIDKAVQQAVQAWRFLGSAAVNQAKPYLGTDIKEVLLPYLGPVNTDTNIQLLGDLVDPTPLQELSAMLDQIVRQRSTRAGQQPGATQPGPIQPGTRQPGARQSIPRQPLQRR